MCHCQKAAPLDDDDVYDDDVVDVIVDVDVHVDVNVDVDVDVDVSECKPSFRSWWGLLSRFCRLANCPFIAD